MKITIEATIQGMRDTFKTNEQVVTFALKMGNRTVFTDFTFPQGTFTRDQIWKPWKLSFENT